ncbi:MAG: M13 family metallopeptidase [Clostridium sp.]|nr:M13 family metallopeptidase [Clostridium sp.]
MLKRKKIIVYTLVLSMIMAQGTFAQGVKAAEIAPPSNISQAEDVRIQDDFYSAVNKDWLKNSEIKDGYSYTSSFTDVQNVTNEQLKSLIKDLAANKDNYAENSDERNIAVLYENYMNTAERNKQGIEPVKKVIDKIKNIKSLDELNNLDKDNVGNTLLQIGCDVDVKDVTRYALYIQPTLILLGNSDEYTNPTQDTVNRKKIQRDAFVKMLVLTGYSQDEAEKKMDNVYKLMEMIAPYMIGQKEASTDDKISDKMYNVMTLDELDSMAPNLKIKDYLKNIKADNADKIILSQPKWFKALNDIYKEENLQMFKDYIEVINLNSASQYLGDDFAKIGTEFSNQYLGTNGDLSQEDKAVSLVNGSLGMPLGKLYSEKYGDAQTKSDVEDMIKNMIAAYKIRIQKLDWMSDETKKNAIEKLDKMAVHVAYPDKWEDYSKLNLKSYDEGGSLYDNILQLGRLYQEKQLEKLNSTVDKDKFICSPQTVNTFYDPTSNSITIPMAALQDPLYNKDRAKEKNYGAIGALIGHEISHAFDNSGAKYDSDGNMADWWTQEDYAKFSEKTQKVRDFYSKVKMDDGTYVNGDVTVGENIADVGGLACVLDVVSSMDNPDYKVLFESFARMWCDKYTSEMISNVIKFDEHPVGKVRSNITLGQFEEFYKAYGITPNDKMYIKPEDRVQIW